MKNTWVVRQFKDQFNPTHWHYGHISGAGFLKVPSNLGKFTQEKTQQNYQGTIKMNSKHTGWKTSRT